MTYIELLTWIDENKSRMEHETYIKVKNSVLDILNENRTLQDNLHNCQKTLKVYYNNWQKAKETISKRNALITDLRGRVKKYEIGDVWKEVPKWDKQGQWKVQFPKGIMTFKTKALALKASETL